MTTSVPTFFTSAAIAKLQFSPRGRFSAQGYNENEVDEAFDGVETTLETYEEFTGRIRALSATPNVPEELFRARLQEAVRWLDRKQDEGRV